jgi:hypothetical protein
MSTHTITTPTTGRARTHGVSRLVRRLEHQRRTWTRGQVELTATERAWNAGIAEGLRLAQITVRKAV